MEEINKSASCGKGVLSIRGMTLDRYLKRANKDVSVAAAVTAYKLVVQQDLLIRSLRAELKQSQDNLCVAQQTVIATQGKLVDVTQTQLDDFKMSVSKTVKTSIEESTKSYSTILQAQAPTPEITQTNLQEAMRVAVSEETRSENLMMREKQSSEKDKIFYIRGGKVCLRDNI